MSESAISSALHAPPTTAEASISATVDEHVRGARTAVAGLGTTEAAIADASLQLEESADRTRSMAREYRQARSRERMDAIADRRDAAAWKLGSSIAKAAGSISASLIGGDYGKLASVGGDAIGAGLEFKSEMLTQDAATNELQASEFEEMGSELDREVEDANKSADKLLSGADAIARARAEAAMAALRG
jgi:hypothetical protein